MTKLLQTNIKKIFFAVLTLIVLSTIAFTGRSMESLPSRHSHIHVHHSLANVSVHKFVQITFSKLIPSPKLWYTCCLYIR
jgi:hypothetical protein